MNCQSAEVHLNQNKDRYQGREYTNQNHSVPICVVWGRIIAWFINWISIHDGLLPGKADLFNAFLEVRSRATLQSGVVFQKIVTVLNASHGLPLNAPQCRR